MRNPLKGLIATAVTYLLSPLILHEALKPNPKPQSLPKPLAAKLQTLNPKHGIRNPKTRNTKLNALKMKC